MKKILVFILIIYSCNAYNQTPGNWAFVKGDKYDPLGAVYGQRNIPGIFNTPAGVADHITWVKDDSFFVFGGFSLSIYPSYSNEFWVYKNGIWTWLNGGPETPFVNYPRGRSGGSGWVKDDTLFLFGGITTLPSGQNYTMNDLWAYANGHWILLKGSNNPSASGIYGTLGVPNISNTPGSRRGAANWLKNDTLFLYGGRGDTAVINGFGDTTERTQLKYADLWAYTGGSWIWMKGKYESRSLGTKGIASPTNTPGLRFDPSYWYKGDSLFLFGGEGSFFLFGHSLSNDLWAYANGMWVWLKGGSNYNTSEPAVYGTKGIAAINNTPGPRQSAASWVKADTLFLYGGYGYTRYNVNMNLDDLWAYSNGNWIWLTGAAVGTNGSPPYGTLGVASALNTPGMRDRSKGFIQNDTLKLFGGYVNSASGIEKFNDVWSYSGGQWIWTDGSDTVNHKPVYGIKGIANIQNKPNPKRQGVSWVKQDSLFLFGGISEGFGYQNDFWAYSNGSWVWLRGSDTANRPGVYGTKGIASPSNIPSARYGSVSWQKADSLFLFGGVTTVGGGINDLWAFANGNWVWLSGHNIGGQAGNYGTIGVPAPGNVPGGRFGSVSWRKGDSLFLFGGADFNGGQYSDLWAYTNGMWVWLKGPNTINQPPVYGTKGVAAANNNPGFRRYSQGWLKDDSLFLFGDDYGHNDLWAYANGMWVWLKGSNQGNQNTSIYGTKGVAHPTNTPNGRALSTTWKNGNKLYLFGGRGYGGQVYNDLWFYEKGNWTWLGDNPNSQGMGIAEGVADIINPGSRSGGLSWVKGDSLFLFGGDGYYSSQSYIQKPLNDLWVFNSFDRFLQACAGGLIQLSSPNAGNNYQWQVNTGSGFVNIINNSNYSGATTANLQINNIPSSFYGNEYRCVVDVVNSSTFILKITTAWTGLVSSAWENPANWSCSILPDANTDIIFNSGSIIVSSNAVCRSIYANTGSLLSVNPGYTLTITGQSQ